ncbi:MAG TPA: S8 family peptidase [Thermoanaerobaculia bacterium]|jgi:subtilisin family serine protease
MRLHRLAVAIAFLGALPIRAELLTLGGGAKAVPGLYIVIDEDEKGLKGFAAVHGEIVRELRLTNFPSGWVMKLSPGIAESLGREGYSVTPEFSFELPPEPLKSAEGPSAPWPLDRDDQRMLPLDGFYRYTYTGKNVRAYVLDSAIYKNADFGNRLDPGADFVGDGAGPNSSCGEVVTHGTLVADILGGETYGVAKGVTVVPVRVYGCNSTFAGSYFLQALDWILSDSKRHTGSRAVVNMSFGSKGTATLLDSYFKKLDAAGIVLVDAAGNYGDNACLYGPAGSTYTVTAGSTGAEDTRASFSNYGKCVDLFAPSENAPGFGGTGTQVSYGSGTSLAAPQVAGHIAELWEQFPDANPALVKKLLLANATPGILAANSLGSGSPNLLLYTGAFQEAPTRFIPRWFPAELRFTLQLAVGVPNGGVTPSDSVHLFRGTERNGACQGQPFGTAHLTGGSTTVTIKGWKNAPASVCVETSLGAVFDHAIERGK